jgi:Ankyrin repeats (3 copies)
MDTPLLMYAIQYWLMHYREASADGSLNLSEIWCFFDPARKYFQNWDRLYPRTLNSNQCRHDDETNIMCFAAQHNLFELMEGLIAAGVDVNIHGGELGRPLQAAVVEDHFEMARLLVDNGADVNAEGGRFGTAMAAAITLKHQRMIDFLLEKKADVTLSTPLSPTLRLKWNGYRHDFSRHQADKATFGRFGSRFLAPPPGVEGASASPVQSHQKPLARAPPPQDFLFRFYHDKSSSNPMSSHNNTRSELPQHSSSFSHSTDDNDQEAMNYEQD